MRRLIVLKNVNNWWPFTFSKLILKYSSPGTFTVFNTLIGQDTCQLFQVLVCNNMVWKVDREAWEKVGSFALIIVTWLFHRLTKFTPTQLVFLFCAILFSKFISMRDGLEEWTRENFLFMVGKWSRNTSFLSSPRQALKTKLCRRSFQKPVPIVQNTY